MEKKQSRIVSDGVEVEPDAFGEDSSATKMPGFDFSAIPLRLLGFGVLFGWHFLLLFFPIPILATSDLVSVLFERQILLNLSLCIFFILFGWMLDVFSPQSKQRSPLLLIASTCVASLASLGSLFATIYGMQAFLILSVVAMGAGEAMLMLLWLRFYSETAVNYSGRYLAASAVIGSLLCYFTRHLTTDLSLVVIVVLPIFSGIMLYLGSKHVERRACDSAGQGVPNWQSARKPFIKSTLQIMVFSFVLGLFQGSTREGSELFSISDATSVLGIGIAGLCIVVLYSVAPIRPNLNIIHRVSILLFVGGLLLVPFVSGMMANIAATITMTGMILLDLLILILIVDLIRTFDLKPGWVIGLNRGCEYGAFTVGIGLGFFLWGRFGHLDIFPFVLTGIAVFAVITAVLFFLNEQNIWFADSYALRKTFDEEAEKEKLGASSPLGHWRLSCSSVCDAYGLSPRESEIFYLIAKGRNAEYIQNALFISNHTVKTHISNIYKKLEIHSAQELLDIVEHAQDE